MALQPFASLIVNPNVPVERPLISSVVALFDQIKLYGEVPPFAFRLIEPLVSLLQEIFVGCKLIDKAEGSDTVTERVAEQAFTSVTLTV